MGRDIDALVKAVPRLAATPRAYRVLWVDDHPANNEGERRQLRHEGIVFDNVVSTSGGPPVIVYATAKAVAQAKELTARGAYGVADGREGLYGLVREALSRPEA